MYTSHKVSAIAVAAAMVCCVAPAAHAQAMQIDIEPQPLASALNRVAVQTRSQILFRPDVVAGRTVRRVRGSMTVDAALDRLLQDTGLKYRHENNVILIEQPEGIGLISDSNPAQPAQAPVASASPRVLDEPANRSSDQLTEIIVTAQKREESLQGTPISIAVLGTDDLEKRGVASLSDFASGTVPSLRAVSIQGRPSSLTVTMRGIHPGDAAMISRDPTVGVYLDGVYFGRSQGLGAEMVDLERIEVLRGPQGTLFGRNAVGGAISMVSKKPTGELGLDLTAGVRNFDGRNVKAHLNLPQIAGFSIKLDGVWNKRGGWVENPMPGEPDRYAINRRGARVSVLWEPASNLDFLYTYDISRDSSIGGYGQTKALLPGAPPLPPIFPLENKRVTKARIGIPLEPSLGKTSGHSLQATWDVTNELTLRSISAYRKLSQEQYDNNAGLLQAFVPNGVFARLSYTDVQQDQFSQEVQLLGTFDNLKFVLGGFYYEEDADDLSFSPFGARFNADGTGYTLLPIVIGGPTFPERASVVRTRSKAIFGQATYTPPILDERLHLTAGLRWTHDRKRGALTRSRGAVIDIPFHFSSKRIDPAFTAAFDWTEAINTYVRWGRAYRAGGANSRSSTFETFKDEQVETWEIGAKTELFDRRLRFNIAAYSSRYSDRQVDFINPANPSNIITGNPPEPTTIKGVEVDLTARVARGLTLSGSYTFTDWKATGDRNPFSGLIEEGAVLYTPKHSASVALDHEFSPFDGATLSTHLDAVYSSSFYTSAASSPKTGSYVMLNGRVTLGDLEVIGGSRLAFSLWGKNLTNKQWETFQFALAGPGLANTSTAYFNEPRTYGLEARITF